MAFENIDTKRLIDALTQIKQSINYKKIENINSNLKSNSVWVSKSRDNLTSAIELSPYLTSFILNSRFGSIL